MSNTESQPKASEKQEGKAALSQDVDKMIKYHILGSIGVGLVPIPLVDLVALAGIQLNMLRRLAKAYEIPFAKDQGKHLIASLLGGGFSVSFSSTLASLFKTIPVIGQTTGVLSMSAAAGASTYAIGKVFIQHFESGGTFLDFDPDKVRNYYAEMLKEGEKIALDLNSNKEQEIKEAEAEELKSTAQVSLDVDDTKKSETEKKKTDAQKLKTGDEDDTGPGLGLEKTDDEELSDEDTDSPLEEDKDEQEGKKTTKSKKKKGKKKA